MIIHFVATKIAKKRIHTKKNGINFSLISFHRKTAKSNHVDRETLISEPQLIFMKMPKENLSQALV